MKRFGKWLLVMLASAWLGVAQAAATGSITQSASGYGQTPQDATADALVNAARQAIGVAVTLDPDFRKQASQWVITQNQNQTLAVQNWSDAPEPRLPTLAGIQSYRVMAMTQTASKLWKADVEAKVAKNRALRPERSELYSLVVMPFTPASDSFDLREKTSGALASEELRQALISAFTQSGQVRVLDRENAAARALEQLESASSIDASERAKIGHQMGAELLLTGSIERLQFGNGKQSYYTKDNASLALHARIRYRLLDVATGDILASDTLNYDPPVKQMLADLKATHINSMDEPERLREVVYPQLARVVVDGVLDHIFPLQVLKVDGADNVYISQGQGRLAPGDRLAVAKSSQLKDPQTGANINAQQATDLRLEVTRVAPGYAIAKVVEGKAGGVQAGMQVVAVARPQEAPRPDSYPVTPGSSDQPVNWN